MSKGIENPHQFEDESGRIVDKDLAEGMAYAEKPYRDESLSRAEQEKEQHSHIYSGTYKEERRVAENSEIQERLEKHDEVTRQKIKDKFKILFGREPSISEKKLDEAIKLTQQIVEERWQAEAQSRQQWIEEPIPTGIQKAEDFKRTYIRRYNQQPLTEEEALKEADLVREKALEEAEAFIQNAKTTVVLFQTIRDAYRQWGKGMDPEVNQIYLQMMDKANAEPEKSITPKMYEQALEGIERLKETAVSNLKAWLKAQIELQRLKFKSRRRKI
jgi:hypothetical protein